MNVRGEDVPTSSKEIRSTNKRAKRTKLNVEKRVSRKRPTRTRTYTVLRLLLIGKFAHGPRETVRSRVERIFQDLEEMLFTLRPVEMTRRFVLEA
ncbi:hypothetical protein Trydic_g8458 [Trypoxylus dichotomus]